MFLGARVSEPGHPPEGVGALDSGWCKNIPRPNQVAKQWTE